MQTRSQRRQNTYPTANMITETSMEVSNCPTCGLSKRRSMIELFHLGLDELCKLLLCKCKSSSDMVQGWMRRMAIMHKFMSISVEKAVCRNIIQSR